MIEHNNEYALVAADMALTLVDNYKDGMVTDSGLKELSEKFGRVPEHERSIVYGYFVEILESAGVEFDVEQFKY